MIAKFIGILLLSFCSFTKAQVSETPVITNPTFYDDTYVHVPLQFGFPFYGRTFTNSWMHSNGVVSFLDPTAPIPNVPYNPAQWAYCCQGMELVTTNPQLGPQFNYMISPLWTDLYPVAASTFRTEGTSTYQRYFWNNIAEISNMNNLNSFSLEIRPSGFIGATYSQINIQNQQVTAGITGDVLLGEMRQFYYGTGIPAGTLGNWSVNSTGVDQCLINPLSSPTCSGYTEAMCSANPLYNTTCSGYQQAFFQAQCSANPLYDPQCPGYAASYLTYQCTIDPLYATTCEGYEKAYATKMALQNSNTTSTKTNEPLTTTELTTVAIISDPVVNSVITSTATTTSPAAAATSTVPLVQTTVSPTVTTASTEEKKDASSTSVSSGTTTQSTSSSTETKTDQPKTARQELQERRVAAARAKAVEDGKNLASTVGKAADMEQQKAVQNVIIAAMGYTPGFDAYSKTIIPDGSGYKPFTIYNNQRTIDNPAGRRFLTGSDKMHEEMIDSQYNKGK